MRNHKLGAIYLQEKNKGGVEKLIRTRENGRCGNGKNRYRGTAETGTVGIVETGAMGVVGVVAEGMSTSAMTPGPSKISAKYGDRHTN